MAHILKSSTNCVIASIADSIQTQHLSHPLRPLFFFSLCPFASVESSFLMNYYISPRLACTCPIASQQVPFTRIQFFDDDKKNVKAAELIGIKAIFTAPFDDDCLYLIEEHTGIRF